MTLTSLLPTLRDSLPAPLDPQFWPAHTHPTVDDVVISAVSLLRYVELCGTPCVDSGAAVIPLSGGCISPTESATALVVAVTRVTDAGDAVIDVDAVLDEVSVQWSELRLIGRVSHARERRFAVRDARGDEQAHASVAPLPADLRVGDLLAVPCRGIVALGTIRPSR